jgi:DNA repair exonuclease SbcCD nuclease subunit
MRIAIMGDTHFGYSRFYEDSFSQGKEAFDKACRMSDIVIVAGDIFDMKVPRLEVLSRAMGVFETGKKMDRINGNSPIIVIHGTHERRTKESVNPVQLLEKSGFATDVGDKCAVFEKEGEKVAICGFGGVPEEHVKEELATAGIKPTSGAFNIFVFHQTICDLYPMAAGIKMSELPSGFDLYVCGHIHKKIIDHFDGKHLIIPGSTVLTQLKREEIEPKGFVLFDTKTQSHEFIPISSRRFIFKEIALKDSDNATANNECRKFLDEILRGTKGGEMPIVKVQITGNIKEGLKKENVSVADLAHEYDDKFYLDIDNQLDSTGLRERIELFRKMYEQKKSVREVGLDILRERLKSKGIEMDIEGLFEKLADSKKIDEYLREIANNANTNNAAAVSNQSSAKQ